MLIDPPDFIVGLFLRKKKEPPDALPGGRMSFVITFGPGDQSKSTRK